MVNRNWIAVLGLVLAVVSEAQQFKRKKFENPVGLGGGVALPDRLRFYSCWQKLRRS